tara:strand:- start:319 stop:795 length:477 start_codon:yes stop_codon:yes gene_type:complete
MDIIIKKYGFKEGLTTRDGEIINWPYDEPKPTKDDINLMSAQEVKKLEVVEARNKEFSKPLQARDDLYLRAQPEVNIFLAANSMGDGSSKEWAPCDVNGVIQDSEVAFTKSELVSVSNHYEERKTTHYNQCRRRCRAIDKLESVRDVESYDVTQAYEA